MAVTKANIQAYILELLAQLASDWEYDGEITADTLMFTELGFQSLDAVVLGNSLQEHYGQIIPYADLLASIGQREFNDVAVGEWVDFTYQHLNHRAEQPGAEHDQ